MIYSTTSEILENLTSEFNQNKKTVFFDFFDTISTRTCHPEFIKKRTSAVIADLLSMSSYSEVYELRVAIEMELYENSDLQKSKEISFLDLSNKIYDDLMLSKKVKMSKERFYEFYTSLELGFEKQFQKPCDDVNLLLKDLFYLGYEIFIISDFYHDKFFLNELIENLGLNTFIKGCYVSSDYHLTKRDGKLYEYVLNEQKLKKESVVMIGDNQYSDWESAKNIGIQSYLLNRSENKERVNDSEAMLTIVDKVQYEKKLNIILKKSEAQFSSLAYVYSIFSYILLINLFREDHNKLNFLSREGQLLENFYKKIALSMGLIKLTNTSYVKVSRRSTMPITLESLEQEQFNTIFRQYVNISTKHFLKSIGWSEQEISFIEEKDNLESVDKIITDFPNSEIFAKLKKSKHFREIYEVKVKNQKQNFSRYVEKNFLFENGKLILVEAGWKGTIQDNLSKYFKQEERELEIIGYYLGIVLDVNSSNVNKKYGLLFDVKNYDIKNNLFDIFRSLYEITLAADHGSAESYTENGVDLFWHDKESKLYNEYIAKLQKEYLLILDEIISLDKFNLISIKEKKDVAARLLAKNLIIPTKNEINLIYNAYHYENFGVYGYTTFQTKKDNFFNFIKKVKEREYSWFPLLLVDHKIPYLITNAVNKIRFLRLKFKYGKNL